MLHAMLGKGGRVVVVMSGMLKGGFDTRIS